MGVDSVHEWHACPYYGFIRFPHNFFMFMFINSNSIIFPANNGIYVRHKKVHIFRILGLVFKGCKSVWVSHTHVQTTRSLNL